MIDLIVRIIIFIILGYSLGKLIYITKRIEETIEEINKKLALLKVKIENQRKLKEEDIEEMEELIEKLLKVK